MAEPMVTVTVRVPARLLEQLRKSAEQEDRTVSNLLRNLGRRYIEGTDENVRRTHTTEHDATRTHTSDDETVTDAREPSTTEHDRTHSERGSEEAAPFDLGLDQKPPPKDPPKPTIVGGEDERAFDEFWQAYPKRNGRRIGRAETLAVWCKLKSAERERALVGARHLAASDQLPKDPIRFVRRSKLGTFVFDDWQDDPEPYEDPEAIIY